MNDAALFDATVPVFRHYLGRIEALLEERSGPRDALLQRGLAPGAFTAAQHFATALGFPARTVLPLVGREVPDAGNDVADRTGLLAVASEVRALLESVDATDFVGASDRVVRHVAGAAELEQDAATFVTLFAMPNFFFHLATAFAALRSGGADLGKADFDGQHVYAPGFRF